MDFSFSFSFSYQHLTFRPSRWTRQPLKSQPTPEQSHFKFEIKIGCFIIFLFRRQWRGSKGPRNPVLAPCYDNPDAHPQNLLTISRRTMDEHLFAFCSAQSVASPFHCELLLPMQRRDDFFLWWGEEFQVLNACNYNGTQMTCFCDRFLSCLLPLFGHWCK